MSEEHHGRRRAGERDGQVEDAGRGQARIAAAKIPTASQARPRWPAWTPRVGERQAAEPGDDVRELVGVALEQQHVAGLDGEVAQPVAERLALARDAQQVDAEAVLEAEAHGAAPGDPGVGRHHHLDHGHVLAGDQAGLGFAGRRRAPASCRRSASRSSGPASITRRSPARSLGVAGHAGQAPCPAHQPQDRWTSNSSARGSSSRTFLPTISEPGDPRLGDVGLQVEAGLGAAVLAPARDQAPADQRHEGHAGERAGPADRGEVEHAEGHAQASPR